MHGSIWLGLVISLMLVGAEVSAESLGDRLSRGVAKAGQAVDKAGKSVVKTVDSTIALVEGEATPELTRQKLDATAAESLARLFAENPAASEIFRRSAGYAVIDSRRSMLLGIAAGFGRGVAVPLPVGQRTYMKMTTGGVGLGFGIGGFESQIVILFETPADYQRFVTDGYDASGEAGMRMGDDKAGEVVRFVQGRSIFVLGKKGWRVNASAAGTKYWPDPGLNRGLPPPIATAIAPVEIAPLVDSAAAPVAP